MNILFYIPHYYGGPADVRLRVLKESHHVRIRAGQKADRVAQILGDMTGVQHQRKWRFLTNFDPATNETSDQLRYMNSLNALPSLAEAGAAHRRGLVAEQVIFTGFTITGAKTGPQHMTNAVRTQAETPIVRDDAEQMAKYGITRIPVEYFHFKEFRYVNLDDAIAQAKRERQDGEPKPSL